MIRQLACSFFIGLLCTQVKPVLAQNDFVHPGVTLTITELNTIRREVNSGSQPRKAGWDKMMSSTLSSLSYQTHQKATVLIDQGSSDGFVDDSAAIFSQALQWYVTGDRTHAQKAVQMMNNWSKTLKSIVTKPGVYSLQDRLVVGWVAKNFAEGAEIIRYTYSDWESADIDKYEGMLANIFWPLVNQAPPTCHDYGPGCQFRGPGYPRASNHEASYAKAQLALGVFLNDRSKFNAGLERYRWLLPQYVDTSGEANETCRDPNHTQMGLGELAQAAEVGWSQGIDLYGELSNRLASGYEYAGKLLSGVPQQSHCGSKNWSGAKRYLSWEVPFNHYHNREGLAMPYSSKIVDATRPTGYWFTGFTWQTLTHAAMNGEDHTSLPPPPTSTTAISESFTSTATNFTPAPGGTWGITGGAYSLSNPASFDTVGNGNISVHNRRISGNFTLTANASVIPTNSNFDDFSIIFDFQNAENYYYASFNEANDPGTNGVFKVEDGVASKIADMGSNIAAGTTYTIKVVKTGSTVEVYRDNVLQATAKDSATSGMVGFGSRNNAATFDNLEVKQ